jgi:predicted HTH domain antitoxin
MSITLELPEIVKQQIGDTPEAVSRALFEEAVIRAYREGSVSHGRVGVLLGLDWEDTEAFLARHQVPLNYSLSDFEADVQANHHLPATL